MQNSKRKDHHIALAVQQHTPSRNGLDGVRFVHHALPEQAVSDVSLQTHIAGIPLNVPFYINAMTGGSRKAAHINAQLADLARQTGLAMASGSVSVALREPQWSDSFAVIRRHNPNGVVFANLGAHHSVEAAHRAVALLEADALQIHLNAAQELTMPEGDRTFKGWLDNIATIVAQLSVPVIVKEVGFGLSAETVTQLRAAGVRAVDVSGRGGTNFAAIENACRPQQEYAALLDWGQTTAESLLDVCAVAQGMSLIASGGIQTPLQVAQALALGADAVSVAGYFLQHVLDCGVDETVAAVAAWQEQLAGVFALVQARTVADMRHTDVVLSAELAHWCRMRGIEWQHFAQRRQQANIIRDKENP